MRPDGKIRIVIVEDHKLFRKGLIQILKGEEGIEVIGEASNGLEAIDVISDLKPDIALLDIKMPKLDGIQLIPIIKQKSPQTKAIMVTASKDEVKIFKSFKAGAKGYLSKDTTVPHLIKAIKVVQRGEVWIERKLIASYFSGDFGSGIEGQTVDMDQSLTPREQEVLSHLIKGYTDKEIANELFISEKTVKNHLNKIFKKLKVSRRLDAILSAIKLGFT